MFRMDLTAALVCVLCVVQIQGYCEYATELTYDITCTDNVNNDIKEGLYLDEPSSIAIQLTKVTDVTNTVTVLKSLNVNNVNIVKSITYSDSNITALPSALLTLEALQHLNVSNNNITSINLNILPYAKNLTSLNLSYNIIEEFEPEIVTYMSTKRLILIDLSHNKLERVPINCFYSVHDSLENLNLSYNQISDINFYAFSNLLHLKTLRLSHNKIVRFGFFLYPLKNLQNLDFNHNLIKEINAESLYQSTSLEKLDLSFNDIELIEDRSFGSLTDLTDLNLSHNNLTLIKEIMLRNNTHLASLDFSFNNISYIEPGTFSLMENLNHIGVEHAFTMPIQQHVLTGINVRKLNFVGSTIRKLEDRPFISIGNRLVSLNLSSCGIREISETALYELTELVELDLSNNELLEIDFQTVDLKYLSKLNLSNNLIREIKSQTFEHFLDLTVLDLSNNKIQIIPALAFKNMKNLEIFKICNNNLNSSILSNTFYGLEKIKDLELTNTKIQRFDNYAFSGLKSLKTFNASYGKLNNIDYYALTETGNIEILDLSYNQLQNFNVKLLPNTKLKELYLNNNKIGSFSKKIFDGLVVLSKLNLSNNNLYMIESFAFASLKSLSFLDLSHNPDLKLGGNVFENANELDTVLMRNVSNQITFESSNISIKYLDISSSGISNVSTLHLHNIKKLTKLDLSQNNITILDQFSFGDITLVSSFTWLNLSHNNLEVINAGTFLSANYIMYLDLSYNKLDRIQFGALRGLNHLHILDLSNNSLFSFKITLLYNIPTVTTIYLDNNKLYSLGLTAKKFNLQELSVGGNDLSCDDLVSLKINDNIITSKVLDYYTENVDGIVCTNFSEQSATLYTSA